MSFKNIINSKILTHEGYKSFKGIQKIYKPAYKFIFDNKQEIITGKTHRFICDGLEIYANSLKPGDTLLDASNNVIKIISIEDIDSIELYDIIGVENKTFIADGINHHNCEFLGSTYTVIDATVLSVLFEKCLTIRPIKEDLGGSLKIYELPEKDAKYIIGVDPSKGTGKHDACLQVIKIVSLTPTIKAKQVAVFASSEKDSYSMAQIVNRLSKYYNNAIIACEGNGEGAALVTHLWHTFQNPGLFNEPGKAGLGIFASLGTKSTAVTMMKRLIENFFLELVDIETINQLATYIEDDGGKTHGQGTQPDDLISALYWACFIFAVPNFFDEEIGIYSQNTTDTEEEAWGILSDINDNFGDTDFSWLKF